MTKVKDMDAVAIIMEIEGGELTIEDIDDWRRVKDIVEVLARSQGFYARLLSDMKLHEKEWDMSKKHNYPVYM